MDMTTPNKQTQEQQQQPPPPLLVHSYALVGMAIAVTSLCDICDMHRLGKETTIILNTEDTAEQQVLIQCTTTR
jgi:hypothetical protein